MTGQAVDFGGKPVRQRVDVHYGARRPDDGPIVVTILRLRPPAPPVLTERLYKLCVDAGVTPAFLSWNLKLLCAHTSIGEHDSDQCVPEEYRVRPRAPLHGTPSSRWSKWYVSPGGEQARVNLDWFGGVGGQLRQPGG